ncbi:MAG: hypothetical protein ACK4NH_03050 [Gemmobacter sp.]
MSDPIRKGREAMDRARQSEGQGGAAAPVPAQPAARRPIHVETLRDDDRLRIWRHPGQGRRLVVAFSGVGTDRSKPPPLELARVATGPAGDPALFFADPARSWLNAPGLIEEVAGLVQAEAARLGVDEVVAVGHSMGGFSALALGGHVRLSRVLALSPQFSVDPSVVPDEPRWPMFRKHIAEYRIRRADEQMRPGTQYYVIFGKHRREAPQLRLVPKAANVALFMLPDVRHDSVKRLAQQGVLEEVIQLAFGGRTRKLRILLREQMRGYQVSPEGREAA